MAKSKRGLEVLGMPVGTAMHRVRKQLLFRYAKAAGDAVCFRCGRPIETEDDMTVDHKIAWLAGGADLFWDLSNIAFSHHGCNSGAATRMAPFDNWHGNSAYTKRGCRCETCRAWKSAANKRQRDKSHA